MGSDDFKAICNASEAYTKISSKLFALTFMQETKYKQHMLMYAFSTAQLFRRQIPYFFSYEICFSF